MQGLGTLGVLISVQIFAYGGNPVSQDDEVFVEVRMHGSGKFLGYMQTCDDHAIDDKPHVCAYTPKRKLKIGKYCDPARLNSVSFTPVDHEDIYACPCNFPGTLTWMHGDDHAITEDDQAEFSLVAPWALSNEGVEYDKPYLIKNHRWNQYIGAKHDDPPCSKDAGKYCLNINEEARIEVTLRSTVASCAAQNVTGVWVYQYTIATTTTETWKYGTAKTHKESKTSSWSKSVTLTVEQGWDLEGAEGKMSLETKNTKDISKTYENDWTDNEEFDFSLTWNEKQQGMSAWQFHFNIEDSCQHTEVTKTKEFAVTPNRLQMPCCVPGYAADAPYYTNCVSSDYLIPGGLERGCSVKMSDSATDVVV